MLDVYVDRRSNFRRMKNYTLHRLLRELDVAGLRWRVFDGRIPKDIGAAAIVHVDLTELPVTFHKLADQYSRCINGRATTIDRRLYSRLILTLEDRYGGPAIVKTVLNSQGFPELRYAARSGPSGWLKHLTRKIITPGFKKAQCPDYEVYPTAIDIPQGCWSDQRLIVERFAPGALTLPIVKYRYHFFLDAELTTRSVCASLLCEEASVETVEFVSDIPSEVIGVRQDLHLDFGAIDYFVVDDECYVIDANKTIGMTETWIERFPQVQAYVDQAAARLIAFIRNDRP